MTDVAVPAPRRTQRERREATVARLLDATIDAVGAVGYARASIKEIATRAGVSHGGLFRHFASRADLVVAAAEEASHRHVLAFRAGVDALAARGEVTVRDLLLLVRDRCRSPTNAVWQELLVAARTDDALRPRVVAAMDRVSAEVMAAARELLVTDLPVPAEAALARAVRLAFDADAVAFALTGPTPDDDALIDVLAALLAPHVRV